MPYKQSKNEVKKNDIKIKEPAQLDVLCGRGGMSNHHPGNEWYRRLIRSNRPLYRACPKHTKLLVSKAIVQAVEQQGGRFLERNRDDETWYEVTYKRAVEKTSQGLRERDRDEDGNLIPINSSASKQEVPEQFSGRSKNKPNLTDLADVAIAHANRTDGLPQNASDIVQKPNVALPAPPPAANKTGQQGAAKQDAVALPPSMERESSMFRLLKQTKLLLQENLRKKEAKAANAASDMGTKYPTKLTNLSAKSSKTKKQAEETEKMDMRRKQCDEDFAAYLRRQKTTKTTKQQYDEEMLKTHHAAQQQIAQLQAVQQSQVQLQVQQRLQMQAAVQQQMAAVGTGMFPSGNGDLPLMQPPTLAFGQSSFVVAPMAIPEASSTMSSAATAPHYSTTAKTAPASKALKAAQHTNTAESVPPLTRLTSQMSDWLTSFWPVPTRGESMAPPSPNEDFEDGGMVEGNGDQTHDTLPSNRKGVDEFNPFLPNEYGEMDLEPQQQPQFTKKPSKRKSTTYMPALPFDMFHQDYNNNEMDAPSAPPPTELEQSVSATLLKLAGTPSKLYSGLSSFFGQSHNDTDPTNSTDNYLQNSRPDGRNSIPYGPNVGTKRSRASLLDDDDEEEVCAPPRVMQRRMLTQRSLPKRSHASLLDDHEETLMEQRMRAVAVRK